MPERPGVIPRRSARLDRRGHGRTHRGIERGQHVGLGVEDIGGVCGFCPGARAIAEPDAGGDIHLRARHAARELGADLEQHQFVEAARLVVLRRRQQRRQQARAHGVELGGDGILHLPRIVAAAEQFRVGARNKGERNSFVEAARGQRPAHNAGCGAAMASVSGALRHGGRVIGTDGTLSRP